MLEEIITLLQSGGWGIAAICIYSIYVKDKQITKLREDTHEEFVALLRENIDLMSSIKDLMSKCSKVNNQQNMENKEEK
jgi:hypothetical protein